MRHIKMSWRSPARLGAGIIVAAALLAGGSAGASSATGPGAGPVVATANGAVRGMTVNSTEEFLGLPYAAPPAGALRWQPPAPPAPWSGVREAVTFAPHCPQPLTRRFGGNPRDVTIFGQSTGGQSALAQMASPGARGLFTHAIVESGTDELTQALATAEAAGAAFAAKVGCTAGTPAGTAACLRSLPVSTIVGNQDSSGYEPDVDGAVLPQSVKTALASGQFNRVPVITGTNHDEYRLFVGYFGKRITAANYQARIASTLGTSASVAAIIARQYPLAAYPSPSVALGAVGTDAIFACPAVTAEDLLSWYVPTYACEFNDENAPEPYLPPKGFPYGAAHESEEQYLFSLSNVAFPAALTATQQRLAAAMKRDWTSFAALGFPAALWPRFSSASPQWESLIPPRPRLETDFAAVHHCTFWSTAG